MKRSKKVQLFSLSAIALMLAGVISMRVDNDGKVQNVSEETVIEEINEENNYPSYVVYEFHYSNDTVDIDESINGLGIVNNNNYPYDSYRFLRFVDNDSYEKFAIANVYVDYKFDNEGNVLSTTYNYYDAFNGNFLLSTNDKKEIKTYNSEIVYYLMESGKLLDLRECVKFKGLNTEYANGVMSDDVKNKSLSTYDVARMYVLLVNSSNRFENNNQMTIG